MSRNLRGVGSHGAPEATYPVVHVAPPSGVLQTAARAGLATKSVALTVSFGQATVRLCASRRPRAVGSVSVWTLDGKLVRDFYGPGRYGGGGTLDPRDRTRFYYDGMEFALDWRRGCFA